MKKAEIVGSVTAHKDSDHLNAEGFPSYSRPLEEQFIQVLLTNTLGNTFYSDRKENAKEAIDIHSKMLAKDPEFYAKGLIHARNKGFMRTQPILGEVFLSTLENKSYARKSFNSVIQTPGDLTDFIDFCRKSGIRQGLGRCPKSLIVGYLKEKMNEYYAIKYANDLKHAIRIARPSENDFDTVKKKILKYLMEGKSQKSLKQITAMELLKKPAKKLTQKQILKAIEAGRLPYEAVTGVIKPDVDIWSYLMKQMPYFALLRHLATLNEAGVFKVKENVDYAVEKLTDKENIRNSKMLPFRFYSAYQTLKNKDVNGKILDALVKCQENSFVNIPELGGTVAIGVDVSGSMKSAVSDYSSVTYNMLGGLFGAALFKKNKDAIVIPFSDKLHLIHLNHSDTLMTNAEKIANAGDGGTNLDLPMDYLMKKEIKADTLIVITDNEEWAGRGFLPTFKEYKRKVNPNLKAILIQLTPQKDAVAGIKHNDIYYVYGWNDNVLTYLNLVLNKGKNQIDEIKKIKL